MPEGNDPRPQKHNCSDCHACQWCSDSKCRMCQMCRPKRKDPGKEKEITGKSVKITLIGSGVIGSTVAYTLMLKNLASEIVLVNRNRIRAQAKASDMAHCTPLTGLTHIQSGSYADSAASDIVVITAGALPAENGTRMDVLAANVAIYQELIPEIVKYSPESVIIVITNPVDVMAYVAYRFSSFPPGRVIGSGTLLDTLRLKYILGRELGIAAKSIEAAVIGEHGDSMVPVWSRVKVDDADIQEFLRINGCACARTLDDEWKQKILHEIKRAGWEIRLAKEHSCYAISLSVVTIIEHILGRRDKAIPVSTLLQGEYGINGLFLSLPVLLDHHGVRKIEAMDLNSSEMNQMRLSAGILGQYISEADNLMK